MGLKYMQKLKDNPNVVGEPWAENKSMTNEEINSLEKRFNNEENFPLAFKEFLLVAGRCNGLDSVVVDEDFEELREDCEESLEYSGYTMDRSYFVFDRLDSIYSIFFLDEEKEDPDIYILDPSGAYEGNEPFLKDGKYTFSKMINDAIYRGLNNIPL